MVVINWQGQVLLNGEIVALDVDDILKQESYNGISPIDELASAIAYEWKHRSAS
jgi:hypothetical protein